MNPRNVREAILFAAGLLLAGYETVAVPEPRVLILGMAAAMLGLPATLALDRSFRRSEKTEEGPRL